MFDKNIIKGLLLGTEIHEELREILPNATKNQLDNVFSLLSQQMDKYNKLILTVVEAELSKK